MESEPVPTSSVLFDADGTQLPDPLPVLPDALTGPQHSHWPGDAPEFTPVPLPPVPDGQAMREAFDALLGDRQAGPEPGPEPGPQAWSPAATRAPATRAPAGYAPPTLPRPVAPVAPRGALRRRITPESARQLQIRSSSGVRTGCVIALVIFGVVAFNIVAGIVQVVAGLFS